jgi:hypothetical protein
MKDELPDNDILFASERKAHGWAVRHRWFVLGAMLFAQTAFAAVFNPIGRGTSKEDEIRDDILIGFILAQAILYAIWAVFAPQRFYVRFLWAFFLLIAATFAIELSEIKDSGSELGSLALLNAAFFPATVGILSFIKLFTGWKLRSIEEGEAADGYLTHQFGIKHVIWLTTLAALALGLFQSLAVLRPDQLHIPAVGELCLGCVFFVAMFSSVVFAPWFILSRHRRLWISLPVSACLIGIFETAACSIIPRLINTPKILDILFLQLGAAISLSIAALTLRRCGYRLERVRKNSQGG